MRSWRLLRKGCLPMMIGVSVLFVGCCSCSTLSATLEEPESWPMLIFAAYGGLFVSVEVVHWVMGLAATALTATSISAEVEAQTYRLLRVTPIPARQIALAKFGAAFWQLRVPLTFVMVIRGFLMVSVLVIAIIFISIAEVWPDIGAFLLSAFQTEPASVVINVVAGAGVLGSVLLLVAFYLIQPALNVLLFAAVGLFASSVAKTRSTGLLGAAGLRIVLWMISYVFSQIITAIIQLMLLPIMLIPAGYTWLDKMMATQPGLLVLGGDVLYGLLMLITIAAQVGVTLLFLRFAGQRAKRLPYR